MHNISVNDIRIPPRSRQDMGDLEWLAESIAEVGLLQPIGITPERVLVFGERRLKAVRDILGWTEVPVRVVNVPSIIEGEFAENEVRKNFTISERVAIAQTIKETLSERRGRPAENVPILAQYTSIKTRDIAAKKAGFGSHGTYEHAKTIVDHGSPDLIQAVESGKVAVSTAAVLTDLPEPEQAEIVARGEKEIIAAANRIKKERREQTCAKRKERIIAKAVSLTDLPPNIELLHGDFRNLLTSEYDESFDLIVTDPPYSEKYLGLYGDLAIVAARVLKPGGSLLVMSPHVHLPTILPAMSTTPRLKYQWIMAYLMPSADVHLWRLNINVFWKPVLWFVKDNYSGPSVSDIARSDQPDKRFHHWGQSESGMLALTEKFSEPGMRILDPFLGGGTEAIVAQSLACAFVGIDTDANAITTTRGRLAEILDEHQ